MFMQKDYRCPNYHIAVGACFHPQCNLPSFYCNDQGCDICKIPNNKCVAKSIVNLRAQIKKYSQIKQNTTNLFPIIAKRLLEKIKGHIQGYFNKIRPNQEMVEEIERNNITGSEMSRILNRMNQKTKEQEKFQKKLQSFQKQIENGFKQMIDLRIKDIKDQTHERKKLIDSNILQTKEDELNLWKELNSPQQITFLFRASQNNFSESKHRQTCRHVPSTLTIVKTEFKQKIAVYNPLTWPFDQCLLYDCQNKSFVLYLDEKKKFCQKEINLFISDNCNVNKNSFTNLPLKNGSGLTSSNQEKQFKILEYQVFEVKMRK